MSHVTHRLTGNFQLLDGTPAQGKIRIEAGGLVGGVWTSLPVVRDGGGNVIFSGPQEIKLVNGRLQRGSDGADVELPASTDPGLDPSTFAYRATVTLDHLQKTDYPVYTFELLADLDLADVSALLPPTVVIAQPLTGADLAVVDGRLDDLEDEFGDLTSTFAPRHGGGRLISQLLADGTDESAQFLLELGLVAATDAVWELPAGTIRVDQRVVIPHTGTPSDRPRARTMHILGKGSRADGQMAGLDAASGGTTLDLRYSGPGSKIFASGRGELVMRDLTITDNGTSSNPFMLVTNTVLKARNVAFLGNPTKSLTSCDQDAIVLGGTTTTTGTSEDAPFQGYGTLLEGCTFSRIRRAVYGRAWCNAVIVDKCVIDNTCGGTGTAGTAMEFDGGTAPGTSFASANVIRDTLFELHGYTYAVTFRDSTANVIDGSSFFDTSQSNFLAAIRLVGAASGNAFIGCYGMSGPTKGVETNGNTFTALDGSRASGAWVFSGGNDCVLVRPLINPAVNAERMVSIRRSLAESTDPNGIIWSITYGAAATLRGPSGGTPSLALLHNNGTQVTVDNTGLIKNTGNLDLWGGTDASSVVQIRRGAFKLPRYATGSIPVATDVGASCVIADLTVNEFLFADGTTTWRKVATGWRATATLDFPSIAAGATAELTVTVTGAAVGDTVQLGPPASIEAGLMWAGVVSATNTVKVRLLNSTGAAIDPASGVWKVFVTR